MTDILHLSARDRLGGAARATYRLHRGLLNLGVDSQMLVQRRTTSDETVIGPEGWVAAAYDTVRRQIDMLPARRYPDRDTNTFSPAWLPERRAARVNDNKPAVVNLHWVAGGFLHPKTVARFEAPVVWTLHDMWPFTGGCHYAESCTKYTDSCGSCPRLGSTKAGDISRSTWKRKHKAWKGRDFTVVAPSRWLAGCAEASSLFEDATVKVIPNGLDVESFRPRESNTVRSRLSIDPEVKLICFGADWETPRKGTDLLYEALENIDTQAESVQVAVFGHMDTDTPDPDVPIHRLGFVDDEVLQALYSDADVMVVPSRQEAFGQTASEALASGTPVVAFNATGPKDIVDHKRNGYLATPFDTDDLAQGIDWVLADTDRRERLSKRARKSAVEQFSIKTVSNQYQKLYKKLLE